MLIDIVTLFPEFFTGPLDESIVKRAQEKGLVTIRLHNLRDCAEPPAYQVDDYPFGGGAGMILKIEPLDKLLKPLLAAGPGPARLILLTPDGTPYHQHHANELAQAAHLVVVAGHYKGFDERFRLKYRPEEISLGDFVLTGGEIPALALVDSVVRLLPGAVGDEDSVRTDSFQHGLLDHPHYTRPRDFEGMAVPEILLSGNHERIRQWRRRQALARTLQRRPDLLCESDLAADDRALLHDETLQ
jgi:tRNA (guanine37-N1)-methyltransferase